MYYEQVFSIFDFNALVLIVNTDSKFKILNISFEQVAV